MTHIVPIKERGGVYQVTVRAHGSLTRPLRARLVARARSVSVTPEPRLGARALAADGSLSFHR